MLKNPKPTRPGRILAEIYLKQLDWSRTDLAVEIGCQHRKVNEIINGKRSITPEFALELERVLGTTAEMWVHLQAEYDLYVVRNRSAA